MRASIRHQVAIDRPAAEVWAVVGRADLLHHWFPGIVDCRVEGTARTITVATGLSLVEEIVTHDDLQRRFQYRLTGGLVREHLGTIDVLDLGDGTSLVTYATDADPATMALIVGGGTGGALDELARQFTAGSGPALDAATTTPATTSTPAETPSSTGTPSSAATGPLDLHPEDAS